MVLVCMHDVYLIDSMMKVLLDINELVLSYYIDVWILCKGLWPHDRFTKYVSGYGALHVYLQVDLDWGHELGLIRFYVK